MTELNFSALACVDFVIIFDEDTLQRLIEDVKPNILVKGGDYQRKDIVGVDFVETLGGCVEVISFVEGKSTTSLIDRVVAAYAS